MSFVSLAQHVRLSDQSRSNRTVQPQALLPVHTGGMTDHSAENGASGCRRVRDRWIGRHDFSSIGLCDVRTSGLWHQGPTRRLLRPQSVRSTAAPRPVSYTHLTLPTIYSV